MQIRKSTVENPNKGEAASATAKAVEELRRLKSTLRFADGVTFDGCVQEAAMLFYGLFRDRILQLIHNFPEVSIVWVGMDWQSISDIVTLPTYMCTA